VQVFVECSRGSREKHRYNEQTLEYQETAQVLEPYPYPYGFVLGTAAEDGDAVDAFIITDRHLEPETIMEGEALGLLEMHEGDELDHKVLVALSGEAHPPLGSIRATLESFIVAIFRQFPDVEVHIGRILPAAEAAEHIRSAQRTAPTGEQ
jgi:inorganic pyrophosphatase